MYNTASSAVRQRRVRTNRIVGEEECVNTLRAGTVESKRK